MADVVKNYPADFPSLTEPAPNLGVLQAQVRAVVTSATLIEVSAGSGVLTMVFDVAPSAGDLTLIDGVCAAHTGEGFTMGIQKATDMSEQTNSTTTFEEALSLVSGILAAADYQLQVSFEFKVQNSVASSGVQVEVLLNGVERVSFSSDLITYDARYIAAPVTFDDLDTPTISVQFRRAGAANDALIRRVRVAIVPLNVSQGEA